MIEPRDLLFFVGGAAMQQYGVLSRRTSPEGEAAGEVFTRAAPADFTDRFGETKTAAANVPRASWINADGMGLKPYLLIEDGESCYLPFFAGSDETLTIHTLIARPDYADDAGDLGVTPSLWSLGGAELPRLACYFDPLTRIVDVAFERHVWDASRDDWPTADSDTAPGADATEEAALTNTAIPAGDLLGITVQYDAQGPRARLNLGEGWSNYTTATASAGLAGRWGTQHVLIGYHVDALNGAIRSMIGARGLHESADFADWLGD